MHTTAAARAQHAEQQRRTAQAAEQRCSTHNRGRCNETVLQPGFDYETVTPQDAGTLYVKTCYPDVLSYCTAQAHP